MNLDVIENNGGYGILDRHRLEQQRLGYFDSIYGNTKGGIATPTDASPQPAPQLITDSVVGGQTTITGVVFASPDHIRRASRDVLRQSGLDRAGQHPGPDASPATANVTTDANGNALFTTTLPKVYGPGQIFTATGTTTSRIPRCSATPWPLPALAPPTLASIPGETVAPGKPFAPNLQGSDPGGLPLAYTVRVDSLAYHLTSTLGLYESGRGFAPTSSAAVSSGCRAMAGGWYVPPAQRRPLRLERLGPERDADRAARPELQRQPQPAGQRPARPGAGDCKHQRLAIDDHTQPGLHRCAVRDGQCQRRLQHGQPDVPAHRAPHPPCPRARRLPPS